MNELITLKDISKSYGKHQAVKNLSMNIHEGEIFGLLGPNGAGKTTTIHLISSILKQDTGEITINGLNNNQNETACKLLIGVVPQDIALYGTFSAIENLSFWGSLYGIPHGVLKKEIEKVLKIVGLADRKNDAINTFSGGMKRRINIASALLHHPKILLMDEPTVGIDPQSRNKIFEIIQQLNKEGMTIIYTTHYMEEAEHLCKSITIMDHGQVIASGDFKSLKQISQSQDLLKVVTSPLNLTDLVALKNRLSRPFYYQDAELTFECQEFNSQLSELISGIHELGIEIKSIATKKVNLESIFLKLTGKHLRD